MLLLVYCVRCHHCFLCQMLSLECCVRCSYWYVVSDVIIGNCVRCYCWYVMSGIIIGMVCHFFLLVCCIRCYYWYAVSGVIICMLCQVMVRRIDNEGKTVWTFLEGAAHTTTGSTSYSVGFSIVQVLSLIKILIFIVPSVIERV